MGELPTTDASEIGWREASDPTNPRYAQKQRDIKGFVDRYKAQQDEKKQKFEDNMEADYFDAALEVANRMQGNFKMGYSRKYAQNWEKVFK
jgi:hypothetical protein